MDNPLLNFFPFSNKAITIRNNQVEALNAIWEAYEKGERRINLCAPTGTGKTKIARTLMNFFENEGLYSLYVTPLNSLVDQMKNEEGIITIKGRPNYPCLAKQSKVACDKGYCQNKSYKPHRECNNCIYKMQYQAFTKAQIANTNASMWLLHANNNNQILIIDEIDALEDFTRMHYTVGINQVIKSNDFKVHVEALKEYHANAESCIDCNENYECKPTNIKRYEAHLDSILKLIEDYEEYKEPWAIYNYEDRTVYKPVTIQRFVNKLIEPLYFVLFMSATPPKWEGFFDIEIKSGFPKEVRPWTFKPLGKMTLKDRAGSIPHLAEFLTTLKNKTIVHCRGYSSVADYIALELRKRKVFPLLQAANGNTDENKVSRYDAIEAFVKSTNPNQILLSVEMNRGIDLHQEEIKNNVIAVIPWDNPTDPLTIAKKQILGEAKYQEDENQRIANIIMQAAGRTARSETKFSQTYITCTDFSSVTMHSSKQYWFYRNKKYFRMWFLEAEKL